MFNEDCTANKFDRFPFFSIANIQTRKN